MSARMRARRRNFPRVHLERMAALHLFSVSRDFFIFQSIFQGTTSSNVVDARLHSNIACFGDSSRCQFFARLFLFTICVERWPQPQMCARNIAQGLFRNIPRGKSLPRVCVDVCSMLLSVGTTSRVCR